MSGNKVRTSAELGISSEHHHLDADTPHAEVLALVKDLNWRDEIDGILVQLPLPSQIDEKEILEAIDPAKDVDGFHPVNVGRVAQGQKALAPCTPLGVIEILKRSGVEIAGKHAVVIGEATLSGGRWRNCCCRKMRPSRSAIAGRRTCRRLRSRGTY